MRGYLLNFFCYVILAIGLYDDVLRGSDVLWSFSSVLFHLILN